MPKRKLISTGCTNEEFNSLSFTKCQGNYTRLVKIDTTLGFVAIRLGEECSIGSIEGMKKGEAYQLFKELLRM
jgi:hypothetical protein